MRNRWGILAVLFVVRLSMSFQFQSVAAVAPLLGHDFGVGLADIGLLIGLYFTPGVALALPGGAIGQRFGDKTTVLGALLLMLLGGLAMAFSDSWSGQIAGRLVAGAGGVLLNVQMTKMVTDWFAGKEIATAMAIFVNSWPAGVAIVAADAALDRHRLWRKCGLSRGGSPDRIRNSCSCHRISAAPQSRNHRRDIRTTGPQRHHRRHRRRTDLGSFQCRLRGHLHLRAVDAGRARLVDLGGRIDHQHRIMAVGVFRSLGGFLADRTKRPQSILVAGAILVAILMLALPRSGAVVLIVIALGLISGLPAGPIMSLPARVLAPATRAIGMGVFYTVYYAAMMLGPVIGGAYAKWSGSAAAAFDFGAAMVLACPLMLWGFNRIPTRDAKGGVICTSCNRC